MHGYITAKVIMLVDNEVYDGVAIAKRVRALLDKEIVEVVQDDNDYWFEWRTRYKVPEYFTKYLRKLIEKKLGLEYYCWRASI